MAGDLTPAYYLVGIGGSIGSGLLAVRVYLGKQRDRWIAQGGKETSLAEKLDANTAAAGKNTEAIEDLSGQIREFMAEARSRLSGHDQRITRVEDVVLTPRWTGKGDGTGG